MLRTCPSTPVGPAGKRYPDPTSRADPLQFSSLRDLFLLLLNFTILSLAYNQIALHSLSLVSA